MVYQERKENGFEIVSLLKCICILPDVFQADLLARSVCTCRKVWGRGFPCGVPLSL